MFESLTQRLSGTLQRLRGRGRLTEENIRDSLREVRVALLSYATLALAALLALMLWLQERGLRHRQVPGWLERLPPLTQLETLLFRSLGTAFALLSATLLTGVLFVEDMLAQHLWHKTVLSVLSWAVLATLLFGRWRWGWRGARAVKLTLTAMALLLLAYFGSKYVLEALQRL